AITASYELLQVERPTAGFGAGVSLRMTTDTPNRAAVLECVERTNGLQYICQKVTRKGREKAQRQIRFFPAQGHRVNLLLVSQGAVDSFLVVANDSAQLIRLLQI